MNNTNNLIDCPDFVQIAFIEAQTLLDLAHKSKDAFLIYQYSKIKSSFAPNWAICKKYAKSLGISREGYGKAFRVLIEFGLAIRCKSKRQKDGTFLGGEYALNRHTENRTTVQNSFDFDARHTENRTTVDDKIKFDANPTTAQPTDDKALAPTYGKPYHNNLRDKLRDRDFIKHKEKDSFTSHIPLPPNPQKTVNKVVAVIPLAGQGTFNVYSGFRDSLKTQYPNILVDDQLVKLINWLPTAQELRSNSGAIHAIHNFMMNASTDFGKNQKSARVKSVDVPKTSIQAAHWTDNLQGESLDLSIPTFA